jgi:hypothetical protein
MGYSDPNHILVISLGWLMLIVSDVRLASFTSYIGLFSECRQITNCYYAAIPRSLLTSLCGSERRTERNVLSLLIEFIFSKLNMYKYLYEHKI